MSAPRIASVIPLRRLPSELTAFSYSVPDSLRSVLNVGSIVRVPFHGKTIIGAVASFERTAPPGRRLQPVAGSTGSSLTEKQLAFAKELAARYYVSPATILHSFLAPPPLRSREIESVQGETRISPRSKSRIAAKKVSWGGYFFYSSYDDLDGYVGSLLRILGKSQQLALIAPTHALQMRMYAQAAALLGSRDVVLLPSKQRKNEFHDAWQRSRTARVSIGSLYALFLPYERLRHIVVCEAENQLFQKAEQDPRYHLADFVWHSADLYGATLLLTGFSPDISLLYESLKRGLPVRSAAPKTSSIKIIDRSHEQAAGLFGPLSPEALDAVERARGPVLLLHNRLGSTRSIVCSDCGFTPVCRSCARPLIMSESERETACRSCGRRDPVPLRCERCGGSNLRMKGMGIARLARDVHRLLPDRRIHEIKARAPLLQSPFGSGDIVVGTTAALARPHTYRCAVYVQADGDIHLPHLHAAESVRHTIFRLAALADRVFIQTYNPDHYVFKHLSSVRDFYQAELRWRKLLSYPPFGVLFKIGIEDAKRDAFDRKKKMLVEAFSSVPYFGPFESVSGSRQRAYIVVRTVDRDRRLDSLIARAYNWVRVEINPYELT